MSEDPFDAPIVVGAEPHDDFTLILTFEGGERRLFDVKPFLDSEVFAPLRSLEFFVQVRVNQGCIEWPGERDLANDMLYAVSRPMASSRTS